MTVTCEYCRSSNEAGTGNCMNCGAPLGGSVARDPHQCPYCSRKLLALGSPNCSYCGRRLPEDLIKANTSDLKRVEEVTGGGKAVSGEIHIVEMLETHRLKDKPSGIAGTLSDLADLFS